MSFTPGSLGSDPFHLATRTAGPLGYNDPAEPFAPRERVGDTPSSLGVNDLAALIASAGSALIRHPKHKRKDLVEAAFGRAWELGWIPFFQEAAKETEFPVEVLMAVGYRESRLDPIYLQVPGDKGHGYGLMQIDIRSYPAWVAAGKWKDAEACISKGAEVLASKREQIKDSVGKKVEVKSLSGHKYHFKGKPVKPKDLLRITIAAYNSGLWAYYHYSHGHDVDQGTTGQDYSRDVLNRAARFRQLLNERILQPNSGSGQTAYA